VKIDLGQAWEGGGIRTVGKKFSESGQRKAGEATLLFHIIRNGWGEYQENDTSKKGRSAGQ